MQGREGGMVAGCLLWAGFWGHGTLRWVLFTTSQDWLGVEWEEKREQELSGVSHDKVIRENGEPPCVAHESQGRVHEDSLLVSQNHEDHE